MLGSPDYDALGAAEELVEALGGEPFTSVGIALERAGPSRHTRAWLTCRRRVSRAWVCPTVVV